MQGKRTCGLESSLCVYCCECTPYFALFSAPQGTWTAVTIPLHEQELFLSSTATASTAARLFDALLASQADLRRATCGAPVFKPSVIHRTAWSKEFKQQSQFEGVVPVGEIHSRPCEAAVASSPPSGGAGAPPASSSPGVCGCAAFRVWITVHIEESEFSV